MSDFSLVGVHVLQPGFRCLLVVSAIEVPRVELGQMIIEAGKQIVGGHDPSGEEFSGHPFFGIVGVVVVGEPAMGKYVYEHFSVIMHPRADTLEKRFVVAGML